MGEEQVLLMCDVVDSTALTERLGDAAAARVWQEHDRAARALLAASRGREVDKTDGLFALFARVEDALDFAQAYHDLLSTLQPPMRARAAIHRAHVLVRHTSADDVARGAKPLDVDGMAKPLVARIGALARPGQTLVSAMAANALPGSAGAALRPLGHWRFKGASEPLALLEPSARAHGPPPDADKAWRVTFDGAHWRPTREVPHSLPAERDGFVGRRQALLDLSAVFEGDARLVNLLGTGGTGKTRLAVHHGWDVLGQHPGGVWFCDLAQAVSLDGVVRAVAQGLRVPLGAGEPILQLGHAIASRGSALFILDNLEQVARHAEPTLGAWLDRAPQARFLVTSREVLGLAGETVIALPPLDVDDAAELFVRRAQSALGHFHPEEGQVDVVRELARRLDGLPLAIELAAARVRTVPPEQLLLRMAQRFDLLLSRGGRPDRQATLRAALDWSWDLLDDTERALLSQLSIFQGGFAAGALMAVVSLPAGCDALDTLGALVDKSLVRPLDGGRFGLLETVREYAELRLRARPDRHDDGEAAQRALRLRHARYFAQLGDHEAGAHRGAELDNLVAACRASVEAGDAALAARALAKAWGVLRSTGPYRAAVDLAARVASMPGLAGDDAALVEWVWGSSLDLLGETEPARQHLRHGLRHTRRGTLSEASARLALAVGSQHALAGKMAPAHTMLRRALAQSQALRLTRLQADALNTLGRLMDQQARVAEARSYYQQALALARTLGDRALEGGLLGNLGGLHHDLGELDAAREHYQLSVAAAEEAGDLRWLGNGCSNLGLLLLELGELDAARARLDQALALANSAGNVRLAYTADCNLGILLGLQGRHAEAEQHLHAAVAAAAHAGDRRAEGQFRGYWSVALARLGRLEQAHVELERGEQALASVADRLSSALLQCDRADVARLAGQVDAARRAHAAASAAADELGCGDASELRRRLRALAPLLQA